MPSRTPHPFSVTLITLLVLTITSLNLLRLALSLFDWQFLTSLEGVSPLYLALSGLVWAAAGFILFWGLWRRKHWARWAVCVGALLYALYYWLDRLFLSDWLKSRTLPANLAFSLGLTLVLLVYIFWTLSRPKIKEIFGEPHERSS